MRILIVDDDSLIRESLKIILELEEDFEIIGLAQNGLEAFEICKQKKVDIVLMDIRMPIMDGVISTKKINESFDDIKVVLLTTFKDEEFIIEAIRNGAKGYILKSQPSDSIIKSLRMVMKGNMVLDSDIATKLTNLLKDKASKKIENLEISKRDLEVITLVSKGFTNKEIASELFLSEGTIRNYISKILEKLELRDRTQLAIFYFENLK